MSLVVNHNLMAGNVARTLNVHYGRLAQSTQRLSTGMRINSAADDAAGLAIRELQRADIAAMMQGSRNANDAISLIQTADGALGIIDEKLIRLKELAEQAATGTYDSTQRLMIESEYQQMASEITRIANATDFNGVKLLDGSLSGVHDGTGINSTGSLKIHFGSGNDSAEDYYYIRIGGCTAAALGVGNQAMVERPRTITVAFSPAGEELTPQTGYLTLNGRAYTPVNNEDQIHPVYTDGTIDGNDGSLLLISEHPGPNQYASIKYGWQHNDLAGPLKPHLVQYQGKNVPTYADGGATFPLPLLVRGEVYVDAQGKTYGPAEVVTREIEIGGTETAYADAYTVSTQAAAQRALTGINNAIVSKDRIRAHLGAIQNRLENTITNLATQAENLQAAESRISDVDVGTEMTEFVRNQILTQSAVAMLSQANSLPQMAMQLIGG